MTVGLTKGGAVFTFGLNRWGQCGVPSNHKSMHHYSLVYVPLPQIVKVDVGLQHCVALSTTGKVYGWGKGDRGQLGNSPEIFDKNESPIRIAVKDDLCDISLGFNHSAALSVGGNVYIWGKGMSEVSKSSRGAEIYNDQMEPRKLSIPGNRRVVEICSSNFTLVARCEDGSLWAMGLGEHDRIAVPNFIPVLALEVDEQLILEDNHSSYLRRGHQRVSIVRANGQVIYQIILHNREAYVKDEFDNLLMAKAAVRIDSGDKLLDISTGWKHDLIIVHRE